MPALGRTLEKHYGIKASHAFARPTPQSNTHIEGLDALRSADCAVFFLRWRTLPEDELKPILDYVKSGKPIVGFRTSTHTFKYPQGSANEHLNDDWPLRVFGAKWSRHHGHLSTTRTSVAPGSEEHPVFRGVETGMTLPSWLYVVEPLAEGCTPLLIGKALNPQNGRDFGPQPVAWTKANRGGRVFFTTLGHPEDFANDSMRRMALNGILWAAGVEVPPEGAKTEIPGGFDPPPDGVPKRA